MLQVRVDEIGASIQEHLEPTRVLCSESGKIIVPKLIDCDEQHQFGSLLPGSLGRLGDQNGR